MVADQEKRLEISKRNLSDAQLCMRVAQNLFEEKKNRESIDQMMSSQHYLLLALGMFSRFEAKKHERLLPWFKRKFVLYEIFDFKYYRLMARIEQCQKGNIGDRSFRLQRDELKQLLATLSEFYSELENYMFPKPKRGRKPKSAQNLISTSSKRGRKPGSKNKPKVEQVPVDTDEQL